MTNPMTTDSFVTHVESKKAPMNIDVYISTQRENAVDTGRGTRVISVPFTTGRSSNETGLDNRQ
jgi:hypothetical protein